MDPVVPREDGQQHAAREAILGRKLAVGRAGDQPPVVGVHYIVIEPVDRAHVAEGVVVPCQQKRARRQRGERIRLFGFLRRFFPARIERDRPILLRFDHADGPFLIKHKRRSANRICVPAGEDVAVFCGEGLRRGNER